MGTVSTRILVVDDYEPWHAFVSTALKTQPQLEIVARACDGLEAVQRAEQLKPDLILLDIGLPMLNGIEAARRIREVSPSSKILFVSENRSPELVRAALAGGAGGYLLKSDSARELLSAVDAILQSRGFVSSSIRDRASNASNDHHAAPITRCHEVAFYADEPSLINGYAQFLQSALKTGNVGIIVTTEARRSNLHHRLEADGIDVTATIKSGMFIPLDVTSTLAMLCANDVPDAIRCRKAVHDLTVR